MGLLVLGVAMAYLLLSVVVVCLAVFIARRLGRSAKWWGWGAALVMYLIPFWDWLPTVAVHQYYCATQSGFWVYKTLDQWKKENPGVMETLIENDVWPHSKSAEGKDVATINQRISLVYARRQEEFLHRWPDIRKLVDSKNNEVLAKYVDFSTSHEEKRAGWSGWKFWLESDCCFGGKERVTQFGISLNQ